ncbi:MAG: 50S ribosomal protein L9 [Holophagaceae bacterium]|nr:50S ribosomal protein L9 [Holophagaceae bacterium]
MEILLIDNVSKLGQRGDVVTVKDGYARNFLLPRKLALPVTAGNKRQIELEKERAQKLRAKELADAQSLAEKLSAVGLSFAKKAGETGHLFGSVTNAEVADQLKTKGFIVDRHTITMPQIKDVGAYVVEIRLYQGVIAKLNLDVTAIAE